jgi:hypothetical protein
MVLKLWDWLLYRTDSLLIYTARAVALPTARTIGGRSRAVSSGEDGGHLWLLYLCSMAPRVISRPIRDTLHDWLVILAKSLVNLALEVLRDGRVPHTRTAILDLRARCTRRPVLRLDIYSDRRQGRLLYASLGGNWDGRYIYRWRFGSVLHLCGWL